MGQYYRHLIKKRKFRYPRIKRRRKMIANAQKTAIDKRPVAINQRRHFGHWEGDLILFRKTTANLITVRERKSRVVLAIKNTSRHARSKAGLLVKYIKKKLASTVKTLTLDNGVEFSEHKVMAKSLQANIFFYEPYKSYQKGAIENANKLLRTKLPRKTKIETISQPEIDKIINKLNDRPMKCLGFKTPNEAFDEQL